MEDYTARQLNESMEQLARELHLNGENMTGNVEYLANIINNHTQKMQELIDSNQQVIESNQALIQSNTRSYFERILRDGRYYYTQALIEYKKGTLSKDEAIEMFDMVRLYIWGAARNKSDDPKIFERYRTAYQRLLDDANAILSKLQTKEDNINI